MAGTPSHSAAVVFIDLRALPAPVAGEQQPHRFGGAFAAHPLRCSAGGLGLWR